MANFRVGESHVRGHHGPYSYYDYGIAFPCSYCRCGIDVLYSCCGCGLYGNVCRGSCFCFFSCGVLVCGYDCGYGCSCGLLHFVRDGGNSCCGSDSGSGCGFGLMLSFRANFLFACKLDLVLVT